MDADLTSEKLCLSRCSAGTIRAPKEGHLSAAANHLNQLPQVAADSTAPQALHGATMRHHGDQLETRVRFRSVFLGPSHGAIA